MRKHLGNLIQILSSFEQVHNLLVRRDIDVGVTVSIELGQDLLASARGAYGALHVMVLG